MKRVLCCLLLLGLLLSAVTAQAEEAVLLWEADRITPVSGDTAVVYRDAETRANGIAALDGTVMIAAEHKDIAGVLNLPGYYRITVDGEGINRYSVLNAAGQVITSDIYTEVYALSDKWLAGAVSVLSEGEEWDFRTLSKGVTTNYVALRYDVYYLPTGTLVGQLAGEDYQRAQAYGDHLLVQRDDLSLQLYDSTFAPVASGFESVLDDPYMIVRTDDGRKLLTSRVTGLVIAEGYDSVDALTEDLLSVRNKDGAGVIDTTGAVVLEQAYDSVEPDFWGIRNDVITVNKDGLKGVFDPVSRSVVLDCAYTDVRGMTTVDGVTYYLVEMDGLYGYATAEGVTCAATWPKGDVTILGCTMFVKDAEGLITLIAADGAVTPLHGVAEIVDTRDAALGRYVRVKNAEGLWGLMDWHGTMLLDFTALSYGNIQIADVTHFVLDGDTMYEIR